MVEGKVLVVDDAPAILHTLRQALALLGIPEEDIVVAETAKDAVHIFDRDAPEVVFMDVQLAGETSEKAAQHMLKKRPDGKIIIMTGLDRGDARVRNLVSLGAYDILEKPLRMERIRELLHLVDEERKGLRRVR